MGFPKRVKDQMLVLCARHCCVCHVNAGLNMEIHHIKPEAQGGENTLDNAIGLCFNCHSFAGHNYNKLHPKGIKYSPEELLLHKANWIKKVEENKITSKDTLVELSIHNKDYKGFLKPMFIREITTFIDRDSFKRSCIKIGLDYKKHLTEMKENASSDMFYSHIVNKIETFDEYLDYMNGDFPRTDFTKVSDVNEDTNCQPIKYFFPTIPSSHFTYEKNLSNCILDLKFTNHGPEVLENYKLYLTFENVIEINTVLKRKSWDDLNKYNYNLNFTEENEAEFVPEQSILVQNDSVIIDQICFRTDYKTRNIIIKWKLFARNFQDEGILQIKISPSFQTAHKTKYIVNANEMKSKTRILPKIDVY